MLRYIIVNDRTPFVIPHCACCTGTLKWGYLREFQTGLYYCPSDRCFEFHSKMAITAIEDQARRVS